MGVIISALPSAGAAGDTDVFPVSQGATTVKMELGEVGEYLADSQTFVENVVNNSDFITELTENTTFLTEVANSSTFITELTENASFITEVTSIVESEVVTRTTVETQSSASYTLTLADGEAKWKNCTNAGATTVTIPPQSSVVWLANTYIELHQAGAGTVTVAAGVGVTLHINSNLTADLNGQYAVAAIKRLASDEWVLFGNLVPV
jgi:hypothetical protein